MGTFGPLYSLESFSSARLDGEWPSPSSVFSLVFLYWPGDQAPEKGTRAACHSHHVAPVYTLCFLTACEAAGGHFLERSLVSSSIRADRPHKHIIHHAPWLRDHHTAPEGLPIHHPDEGPSQVAQVSACSAAAAKSLQSFPTLCNPIDESPPGSAIPGILQARTLEWVAISFSNTH